MNGYLDDDSRPQEMLSIRAALPSEPWKEKSQKERKKERKKGRLGKRWRTRPSGPDWRQPRPLGQRSFNGKTKEMRSFFFFGLAKKTTTKQYKKQNKIMLCCSWLDSTRCFQVKLRNRYSIDPSAIHAMKKSLHRKKRSVLRSNVEIFF